MPIYSSGLLFFLFFKIIGLVILVSVFMASAVTKIGYVLAQSDWKLLLGSFIFEPIGFVFGYGVGKVLQLPEKVCQTISLETGLQNLALVVAMIQTSFENDDEKEKVL